MTLAVFQYSQRHSSTHATICLSSQSLIRTLVDVQLIGVRILASLVRSHVGLAIILGICLGTRIDNLDYDGIPYATNGLVDRNTSLIGHSVALPTVRCRTTWACAINWTLPVTI